MNEIQQMYYTPDKNELNGSIFVTWAGRRVCTEKHSVGPRVLPFYKAVMVAYGSGYFQLNGEDIFLRRGDLFFLFPGVKHHYYANSRDPWVLQWFTYGGRDVDGIMQTIHVSKDAPILRNCMTDGLAECMNYILVCMTQDNVRPFGMIGYAYRFFDEILRIQRNEVPQVNDLDKEETLQKIMDFIDLNFANELNVNTICAHLHYSRSAFSHYFKSRTGMSLPEYINKKRIERAKQLLLNTNLTTTEIALSVGYGDAEYFVRNFKRITGYTTKEYVKQILKKTSEGNGT